MNWSEVLADPCLQDLPYKIETNEYGQIVMTPARNQHGYYQGEINAILRELTDSGRCQVECSVGTPKGVKVADVAWCSDAFVSKHGGEDPFTNAPEICVEVGSASDLKKEFAHKKSLYLAQGAQEVWHCDQHGQMEFFDASGELDKSKTCPDFPQTIG